MTTREFAGIRVTALGDGVALWQEGLRMRHCVGDYAPHCLSGVNRIFHVDVGDESRGWTLSLQADGEGEGGWSVDELRGICNALPQAPLKFWAEQWAREYSNIFESDPMVHDDECPEICMVCRQEWCEKHQVLSTDLEEGILGGVFYEADETLESDLRGKIADLLLAGQKPPTHWPSEWSALYDALAEIPHDELFDLIEDEEEEPAWEAGDAFHDAWINLDGRRIVVTWIEEWTMAQNEALSKYTEVSTAPGLSWVGWNVYADDPEALLTRYKAHVKSLMFPSMSEAAI